MLRPAKPRAQRDGRLPLPALIVAAALAGCGGEPTGDDAYSQKFEKPPEVAGQVKDAAQVNPDPYADERQKEIEASQKAAAKKAAGKAK